MTDQFQRNDVLNIARNPEETGAQALARNTLEPEARHALTASTFAGRAFGRHQESPGIADFVDQLAVMTDAAARGDLTFTSRTLAAQAVSLDCIFTELTRKASLNLADYPDAAERFARLALKAQGNCRATLEALARLHQPREQTVRHVHVDQGAQAIIADHFHHHAAGVANAESKEQCHATGTVGEDTTLSRSDTRGERMPKPGGPR
jgi:hypothetical protein